MRKTFVLLTALLAFTSCKNNEEQNPETSSPIDQQQAVLPENIGDLDDIELNQGELWEVDRGISEGITSITSMMESSNPESASEYKDLGNSLEEELNSLKAQRKSNQPYDSQLNRYFEPLEEKITELQQVDSNAEGERITNEIEHHLQEFSSYFN